MGDTSSAGRHSAQEPTEATRDNQAGAVGILFLQGAVDVKFQRVYSGARWEQQVGYCRALRAGNQVFVTGTAPVAEGGGVHAPGDAYQQTRRCFEIMRAALAELGVGMERITRTRMFVTDITRWEEYGRAHREFFEAHPPTTTMVEVSRLIDPEMLIEIEADAVVE